VLRRGEAVQVDPIKPTLPGTKRLKLKYDDLLSNFVFNVNLRRSVEELRLLVVGRCSLNR